MSRRINLWSVDHEFLTAVAGTGDASIKNVVAERHEIYRDFEREPTWNDALRIAIDIIDNGFSIQNKSAECDCHFLAAEMLSVSCQLNQQPPDSEFHRLSFLETIDICFPGNKFGFNNAFAVGRPWFGSECPNELAYGIIQRSEVAEILDGLSNHRGDFGEGDEWMIDAPITFFEFIANCNSDVWYAG